MLGLTREKLTVPQADLLLLPKGHEIIEISDYEEDMDEMVAVESGDERMRATLQASR